MEGGEDSNLTKTSMPLHVRPLNATKLAETQQIDCYRSMRLYPAPPPVLKLFVIEL